MASDVDVTSAMRAARRGYELGRARTAFVRAAIAATAVASVGLVVVGARALPWVLATFAAMAIAEWRGGAVAVGARRGVLAGAATLLLPLSILRPCCGTDVPMDGVSCCTMPGACVASGAIIGLALALLMPRMPGASSTRRLEGAIGMALGVVSVATLRCAPLFFGEAIGLLGGLLMGVVAATIANVVIAPRSAQ